MLHRSNRPALIAGQDLSALALLNQEEHQARQRPEIQVHFQGISGELIESRNLEVTTWWSSGDLGFFKIFREFSMFWLSFVWRSRWFMHTHTH